MKNDLPTRCIDPVMKDCKNCCYGSGVYPSEVKTVEDFVDCFFSTSCVLRFDIGRPEDEPTLEELIEFALHDTE